MRRATLLIGAVLAVSTPAVLPANARAEQAAEPAVSQDDAAQRLVLARRFVTAMQLDQMSGMITAMITDMREDVPFEKGRVDPQTLERAMTLVTGRMVERLFEALAPVYAESLTLQELEALVGFYESEIGRSALASLYEATPRMAEVMTEMIPTISREMMGDLCVELGCTAEELREAKAAMDEAFAVE